jgi:hypothetical protein
MLFTPAPDAGFCGILAPMSALKPDDFANIFTNFDAPISVLDCGKKCAPYNEYGVPFCCDTHHALPMAYQSEWAYLESNTNLWHLYEADDPDETERLQAVIPDEQVLIECLGHKLCQRNFRSITCRTFPFFPYITLERAFIGLSYYWEYEERCWVINHLDVVSSNYSCQFIATYDRLFEHYPDELENFRFQSITMRRVFGRQKRTIPLLHRDGKSYVVTPRNGALEPIDPAQLPKYGPYEIAALLPFPDETNL